MQLVIFYLYLILRTYVFWCIYCDVTERVKKMLEFLTN
jgi:hypothetical protein